MKRALTESGYRADPEHARRVARERLARLGVSFFLAGCASQQPPAERLQCYAGADLRAQTRVYAECKGVPFRSCPARESILKQLQEEQESCR